MSKPKPVPAGRAPRDTRFQRTNGKSGQKYQPTTTSQAIILSHRPSMGG